jgi:AraC-like DNA-binding protein
MLARTPRTILGKIALDLERALERRAVLGTAANASAKRLATGDGWWVDDVVCTSGPGDRTFEEVHESVSVSAVVAGTFQYRSSFGRDVLTPGSLMLGHPGQLFECGHDHARGDRCVAFHFSSDLFERIAADAGVPRGERSFRASRVPPASELSKFVARASIELTKQSAGASDSIWEETAFGIAATAIRLSSQTTPTRGDAPASVAARVTESVRRIDREPGAAWTLSDLAAEARLSPYHYLRTFTRLTGVTPHQFVLRTRLRAAAIRLAADDAKVIEIALASGFNDVSNFNRAFREEIGLAPRNYRRRSRSAVSRESR